MPDHRRSQHSRWLLATVAALVAALAVAIASYALPMPLLLALLWACILVALAILARHYVMTGTPSLPGPNDGSGVALDERSPGDTVDQPDGLTPARVLYCAGMLTIGQTTLRPLAGFTLSDWFFLGAMCAALAGLAMRRGGLTFRVPALIVLGVSLFVLSGVLSSFDAVAPLLSLGPGRPLRLPHPGVVLAGYAAADEDEVPEDRDRDVGALGLY